MIESCGPTIRPCCMLYVVVVSVVCYVYVLGAMSFVTAWASRVFRKDFVLMVFWERGPSCVGGALWGSTFTQIMNTFLLSIVRVFSSAWWRGTGVYLRLVEGCDLRKRPSPMHRQFQGILLWPLKLSIHVRLSLTDGCGEGEG